MTGAVDLHQDQTVFIVEINQSMSIKARIGNEVVNTVVNKLRYCTKTAAEYVLANRKKMEDIKAQINAIVVTAKQANQTITVPTALVTATLAGYPAMKTSFNNWKYKWMDGDGDVNEVIDAAKAAVNAAAMIY